MIIQPIQKPSPVKFGAYKPLAKYVRTCCFCDLPFTRKNPATKEHLYPRFLGGKSEIGNFAISCAHCNNTLKGSLPLDVFFKRYPWARLNFVKYLDGLRGKIIDGVNYSQEISRRFL